MSVYGYSPPYGFGNDVPGQKKKTPYDDQLPGGGAGGAQGAVSTAPLPGTGYVGSYLPQTAASGLDFSTPTQLQIGSRDAPLEGDAPYQQLLTKLGLDAETAREAMIQQRNQLDQNLGIAQREFGEQSQEQKYGIDTALRSRGAGRSSAREALQARADANMIKGQENLARQTADQQHQLEQGFITYKGGLEQQGLQGLNEAATRQQSARDAIQTRLQQQQLNDEVLRQQAQQNQALINAMNAQSTNPAAVQAPAMQAPSQPDVGFSPAPAAAQPMPAAAPAQGGGGGGQPETFAQKYARMTPAERAAWDVWARGSQGTTSQSSANAAEYRAGIQPTPAAPREPLRPMIGKY